MNFAETPIQSIHCKNQVFKSGLTRASENSPRAILSCAEAAIGVTSSASPRSVAAATQEWRGLTGYMVVSGGIRYSGDLAVVAVPRGSRWSLTLSDIPV